MFTGIIEEIGTVEELRRGRDAARVVIRANKVLEGTRLGDSIAVNGVCLTVETLGPGSFEADVMGETLAKSSLGALRAGSAVNLERAMTLASRLGGHLVQGHVDGTAKAVGVYPEGGATILAVECGKEHLAYIVEKGSVALDGVSLTAFRVDSRGFRVSLAPHTLRATTLASRRAGDTLNIECDAIAKHVEKLLKGGKTEWTR